MKKLLAVVLSGVLCMASLCMTACATGGDVTSQAQDDSVGGISEHASAEVQNDSVSEIPEYTSDEVQESSENGFVEEDNKFIGRMEGRTYINEYFDFYCALDNDWDISSEEELILANQELILSWNPFIEGADAISWNDTYVKDALENVSIGMQLMEAKGKNKALVIMVQKTGLTTAEEYTKFLEDYVETTEEQHSVWADNVEVNVSKTVFKGDQIKDSIDVSIEYGGETNYQKMIFIHKDGYCLTIMTISSLSYEEAESFFDWFGDAEDAVIIEEEPEVQYEVDYLLGTVEENVYTNEVFGFCIEGDEACQYASVEDLQSAEDVTYDKDTLNKLLEQGHLVKVAGAYFPNGKINLSMFHRDAEFRDGTVIIIRGNEERVIQVYEESTESTFQSHCEQVELESCSSEILGEIFVDGFDAKGIERETGQYIYARTLFVQSDDFFGSVILSSTSEEEIQRMTELITKIEE